MLSTHRRSVQRDDHFQIPAPPPTLGSALSILFCQVDLAGTRALSFVMIHIHISRSVHLNFFVIVLVTALGIQMCICVGSFVTTPPAVDEVLTSCGETRLTCSHDNVLGENTRWRITRMDSSLVCQETIDHTTPTPETPYSCNEFRFEDITALMTGASNNNIRSLNSIAMVNPLPLDLSGSRMECTAGSLSTSPSVGSVTLCVIGD